MSVISIILLIFKLVTALPSLISVLLQIIALIGKFKDGGLLNDLSVIAEIIKLILGVAVSNKVKAEQMVVELKATMEEQLKDPYGSKVSEFRDKLKRTGVLRRGKRKI